MKNSPLHGWWSPVLGKTASPQPRQAAAHSRFISKTYPAAQTSLFAGHSTLDVSQMTIKQVDGVLDISDVINTGDSFCGVKDVALALLGRLPAAVLRQAAQDADRSGSLYGVNEILVRLYVHESMLPSMNGLLSVYTEGRVPGEGLMIMY